LGAAKLSITQGMARYQYRMVQYQYHMVQYQYQVGVLASNSGMRWD